MDCDFFTRARSNNVPFAVVGIAVSNLDQKDTSVRHIHVYSENIRKDFGLYEKIIMGLGFCKKGGLYLFVLCDTEFRVKFEAHPKWTITLYTETDKFEIFISSPPEKRLYKTIPFEEPALGTLIKTTQEDEDDMIPLRRIGKTCSIYLIPIIIGVGSLDDPEVQTRRVSMDYPYPDRARSAIRAIVDILPHGALGDQYIMDGKTFTVDYGHSPQCPITLCTDTDRFEIFLSSLSEREELDDPRTHTLLHYDITPLAEAVRTSALMNAGPLKGMTIKDEPPIEMEDVE